MFRHRTWAVTAFAFLILMSVHSEAFARTMVVDEDGEGTASNCNSTIDTPYTTINGALEDAVSGDTIIVCPGTYAEQLEISVPLTITGKGTAVIKPTGIVFNSTSLASGNPLAAIVLVTATTGVTIQSISVDGSANGITGGCPPGTLVGIFYRNASGEVVNAAVRNVRLGAGLEGCQAGIGIFVQSDGIGGTSTVAVKASVISGSQKNGITANELGTTLTVAGSEITGDGPTPHIAQNGVQFAYGATGKVSSSRIANHVWSGCVDENNCNYVSTDLLAYQAGNGLVIKDTTFTNSQTGIYLYQTDSADVQTNTVTHTLIWDGILAVGDNSLFNDNRISDSGESGLFIDGNGNTATRNRINQTTVGVWNYSGTNTVQTIGVGPNKFFNLQFDVVTGATLPAATSRQATAMPRASSPIR